MEPIHYIVQRIDGDYAVLVSENTEEILVARALLPEETDEGSHLLWENLTYTFLK